MERYDFQQAGDCELDFEGDSLTPRQRQKLNGAMLKIKEESKEQAIENSKNWFNVAIIPVLKDFAETCGAILEIEETEGNVIVATLKTKYSLDITESCKSMRMVLALAQHIAIDLNNDDGVAMASLVLIFDCSDILE